MAEFISLALMAISFFCEVIMGKDFYVVGQIWSISALILVVILGISFNQIFSLTKKFTGLFSNEKLMFWHLGSFTVATATDFSSYVLFRLANERFKDEDITSLRCQIAAYSLTLIAWLFWIAVNILILLVFIKYGKPLEDNAKILIEVMLIKML